MVAVKGQMAQLLPGGRGGAGTLFVYPPPPSLTDDGSEQLSNMYEEIPYYGECREEISYGGEGLHEIPYSGDCRH